MESCASNQEFNDLYKKVYTRQSCTYLCRPTQTVKQCGCYDDYDSDLFYRSSQRRCSSGADYECAYKVEHEVNTKKITCPCPDPCSETDYDLEITSRQWPTDKYAELLKASVCEDHPDDCDILNNYTTESLGKNFIKLVIYYKQLNYQSLKEEADIENSQFASDVGGAIGLWIGLSILSIFEIFQLVVELVGYCIYRNESRDDARRGRQYGSPKRHEHDNSRFDGRPVYYVNNSHDDHDRYESLPSWQASKELPEVRLYKGRSSSGGSTYDSPYTRPAY
ncbi:amiloride-sensitive sodium channel subunit alpha-like isoform X2 [Pecten maximus]|uniref:amiloride-sensitive sodium channel subunit alpha-like isoform X2 n=1 Tax=Pecten maximus TaxID=6579 RepID=UPI00145868E8|nr:amiloride-sensitive sodium channel subunit alpha-like isoform X2 [Pecten maximus]